MFGGNKIKSIKAYEILDSRGDPTVQVRVVLRNGVEGVAAVPSGASTGAHEALELRDGDKKRYGGKGVLKACRNINEDIFKVLKGKRVTKQRNIDQLMIALDGTEKKTKLGANAILGVSLACLRAGANYKRQPLYKYIHKIYKFKNEYRLPVPLFNILNGGKHADSKLDWQEFMVIPSGIKTFKDRLRAGSEIFHQLGVILKKKGFNVNVGNEGGYAPALSGAEEALEMILLAIKQAGYKAGKEVYLGIDAASSEFYNKKDKQYHLAGEGKVLSSDQMIKLYGDWAGKYPLISVEDGLAEDGWNGWKEMSKVLKKKIKLIGDDLLVTNLARLKQAVEEKCANAILIKPNQIGTVTETIECIKFAQKNDWLTVISHRSGETMDTTIADLAVGAGVPWIKSGSTSRGERVCKYNRLMEIEEELKL